jgi:hypothetical protein
MPAAAATAAAEDDGQVGFSCDRGYEYVLHLPSAHAVMQVRLVGVSMWHRAGLPAAPQQGTRCGAAPITRCAVCILRQPANGFSISPCARGAQAVTSAAGADPFCPVHDKQGSEVAIFQLLVSKGLWRTDFVVICIPACRVTAMPAAFGCTLGRHRTHPTCECSMHLQPQCKLV